MSRAGAQRGRPLVPRRGCTVLERAQQRRNAMNRVLTAVLSLVCAAVLWAPALAQAADEEAEHPRHLGRRYRHLQHQRLQPRRDGLQDAQHRSARQGRRAVHRLLRPAELHRGPRLFHPRSASVPHRAAHHRHAGFAARHSGLVADDCRPAQGAGLRRPASSARTTWATATSICRRCTGSTSSSATSTT